MNLTIFLITYPVIATLSIAQPWFSRKNVYFGIVFADNSIWSKSGAKKILRTYMYTSIITATIILLTALLFVAAGKENLFLAFNLSLALLILAETLIFFIANRKTRGFKQTIHPDPDLTDRSVVVAIKGDKETLFPLPWLLILLPLFLVTLAVVVIGYPSMPASIPTHFGLTGPDQWAPKSWPTVLSPVFFEVVLTVLVLLIRRAPASVKGNPEAAPNYSRYRKVIALLMILTGLITELIFLVTVISFFRPLSLVWFIIPEFSIIILLPVMILFYFRLARSKTPAGPILNDDGKWLWGQFYYNPSDPSLFVEKRVGIGYTINMARPGAWIVLTLIIGVTVILSVWHH